MLYYREHGTCCIGNMVHVVLYGTWYMLYYREHGTCCIGNMVHVV